MGCVHESERVGCGVWFTSESAGAGAPAAGGLLDPEGVGPGLIPVMGPCSRSS